MGSRTVKSPQPPEDARTGEEITRQAAARALGRRPGLRMLAVVLWSGFLGGVVLLLSWLTLTPPDMLGAQSLGQLTFVFAAGWAISLVPALSAVLLATPFPRRPVLPREPRDGR